MIKGTDIKNMRLEHGLTQLQLARAIYVEESTLANYEAGRRALKVDVLESIANVFGYTVDFNLIKKEGTSKNENFYKEKTYSEIMNMSKEDLTDYIFITQDNSLIARICNLEEVIINSLGLNALKDLLMQCINNTSNDVIYFKLNGIYKFVEYDIAVLIAETNKFLSDLCESNEISKDVLDKACYIDFDLYGDIYRGELCSDCMRLLDKDKNDLGVYPDLLMCDCENPLFYEPQPIEVLEYIKENPILQIKY